MFFPWQEELSDQLHRSKLSPHAVCQDRSSLVEVPSSWSSWLSEASASLVKSWCFLFLLYLLKDSQGTNSKTHQVYLKNCFTCEGSSQYSDETLSLEFSHAGSQEWDLKRMQTWFFQVENSFGFHQLAKSSLGQFWAFSLVLFSLKFCFPLRSSFMKQAGLFYSHLSSVLHFCFNLNC